MKKKVGKFIYFYLFSTIFTDGRGFCHAFLHAVAMEKEAT